jgi:hypothetical protein
MKKVVLESHNNLSVSQSEALQFSFVERIQRHWRPFLVTFSVYKESKLQENSECQDSLVMLMMAVQWL